MLLSLKETFSHRIHVYQYIIEFKTKLGVSCADMQKALYQVIYLTLSITSDLFSPQMQGL